MKGTLDKQYYDEGLDQSWEVREKVLGLDHRRMDGVIKDHQRRTRFGRERSSLALDM